jgi:polyisoprenoid-binding protein YceI
MITPTAQIPGYVAGTWDLDPAHSHIGFTARHLVVGRVRGHFDRFQARIITAEDPLQSRFTAAVDLNSVNTGDQARDNDLRSANFFDAGTYPTMTYRSTGIRRHGKHFIVDGELTIRGVTRPVPLTFDVSSVAPVPGGGLRATFLAKGELNRFDFGVCFTVPIAGLASDKVHLEIGAEAVLRKSAST